MRLKIFNMSLLTVRLVSVAVSFGWVLLLSQSAFAQAPSISYSPSTNVLTVGNAFSITPANAGGAVPTTGFGTVSTFAGSTSGTSGWTNGTGTAARFFFPNAVAIDASGTYYVTEDYDVRKIASGAVVTSIAGSMNGSTGTTNGTGSAALFNIPVGIATDGAGNLYIADESNNEIRKVVISTGVVTLLAGSTTAATGTTNGTGTAARFNNPIGIVYNPADGALYVADNGNNQIRKVTTSGVVTLFAGSTTGASGLTNGTGTAANFNGPEGIAIDASGNFYVSDQNNNEIRKITSAGLVSLVAGSTTGASGSTDGTGTAATFTSPTGIAVDPSGNLYVSERGAAMDIRFISASGQVVTVAGGNLGDVDGNGTAAEFDFPYLMAFDPTTGSLIIPDTHNSSYRKMSTYGWFISPALPSGLSFDNTTGIISGAPTGTFSATTYTVYAVNSSGTSSTTITLSAAGLPPNISYSPSTNVLTVGSAFSITPTNTGGAVQGYGVTTFAGSTSGTSGTTNGTGTGSRFNNPSAIWIDPATGTMYVADQGNNQIRQISSAGVVTLLAGSPTAIQGTTNGTGTAALFGGPTGITGDGAGNLYVVEYANSDVRKIVISTGAVTLLAGSSTGASGLTNGTGTAARFNLPRDITYNATDGALYVADYLNNQIRKVTTAGVVTTFAGSNSGTAGRANGTGTAASFDRPDGITTDGSGNFFVSDALNAEIRKITSGAVVSLFAGSATGASGNADGTGTAATFNLPAGISRDASGNLYVIDNGNNEIRLISTSAVVTTIAGNGTAGYADAVGTAAEFNQPRGAYFDPSGTNLYIADYGNNVIRKFGIYGYTISPSLPTGLTFNNTTGTISGTPTSTFSATVFTVTAYNEYGSSVTTITLSTGQPPNISYSPSTNTLAINNSFSITPTNTGGAVPANIYQNVTTFAGSGTAGLTNGTGTAAQFNGPRNIWVDPSSATLYLTEYLNNDIRKITSAGVVTLFAGSTTGASGSTDGTGTAALLNSPADLTSDGSGNFYVVEASSQNNPANSNNDIRKVVISTAAVTRFAGSGNGTTYGTTNGTGTAATFNVPIGITYNASDGNMYVTDYYGNDVRKVTTAAVVSLFAGSATQAYGSTNGTGSAALFRNPEGMAADPHGNLYLCDVYNNQIRKITPAGVVTLFAGSPTGAAGFADGTGTAATFNYPKSIICDGSGNLYVTDATNNSIRFITTGGVVTTVFGNGTAGLVNGVGTATEFNNPRGMAFDPTQANIYVADYGNNVIRKISLCGYTISPSLPSGLSFDGTTGTISGTPTTTFAATTFTVTAYNQYGSSATTITLSCVGYDWTGTTSTDWATGSNWATGTVPTSTSAVRIGVIAYTGSQPTLSSSTSVYSVEFGKNTAPILTIASGAILTGATNGIIVDASAIPVIKGPGTFTIGSGCASTIPSTASLTFSANAILALGTNASLTNSGTLTLGSDANGSSSIAALPSGASVSGTITVQRYITGGFGYRGYRLISSPVYAATVGANKVYSINYLDNSMYLTGASGGGFDQTGNPTIYLFREDQVPLNASFTDGNFWGISAINNTTTYNYSVTGGNPGTTNTYNIPVGDGMMVFFRGNRASATVAAETEPSYVTPVSATLSTSGTLNQGQVTVSDWYTPTSSNLGYTTATANTAIRGFNLVGNPYPSSIDWNNYNTTSTTTGIYASNIGTTVYELNPVNHNYGVYNKTGGTSTNSGSNIIASGQGFFVQATGANPQLIFNESAKTSTQNTGSALLMAARVNLDAANTNNNNTNPYLRLQIAADSINTDDTYIGFDAAAKTQYTPGLDAKYLPGFGQVKIASFSSDSVKEAINMMPLPGLNQAVIPLFVTASAYGTYKLSMREMQGIPKLFQVWLMDNFNRDSLDIRHNPTYAFDITTDTGSYGSSRFKLVIRQDPALGVHLLNFTAVKATDGAQVGWVTENEADYTSFTVERSTDKGVTFTDLEGLVSSGLGTYGFLDKTPPAAADQYRLKITDLNGTVTYSNIVTLIYGNGNSLVANPISVYPNPASSIINLSVAQPPLTAANAGTAPYKIIITNITGTVVKTAVSGSTAWQGNVSDFLPGTYILEVVNSNNNTMVGRAKFIKI